MEKRKVTAKGPFSSFKFFPVGRSLCIISPKQNWDLHVLRMPLEWRVICATLSSFLTWTEPINRRTVRQHSWGFCPWSKLSWNAWKYLKSYAHLKMNVNHLLAWRQLIITGQGILHSLTKGQLFQWLSGNKLKSTQTWVQAQRKQV